MSGASAGDLERLSATIVGRVQGVGFRWWVRSAADRMGLTGWVMNGADERSVELVAEGPAASLDQFERLLREGPPGAAVDRVEAIRSPASGSYGRFQITRP
ncbi:MAG: acylphosphatase [Chloroflexota bacterium]